MPIPSNYRWLFEDPVDSSSYRFPINPNKMTSPYRTKQLSIGWAAYGMNTAATSARVIYQNPVTPYEWTFSGRILTQDHHDAFVTWLAKTNPVHLTDHYGITRNVVTVAFKPNELKTNRWRPDRYDYDFTVLILGEV